MHPEITAWIEAGRPVPPPASYKQALIDNYAKSFAPQILIETGTYLGDMVYAMKDIFQQIYSIELDPALYQRAQARFSPFNHISIIHGDSSEILPEILEQIHQPALFWLDAHYSGGITARGKKDTPVLEELNLIINHPYQHIILIDDARDLGHGDYPSIDSLRQFVAKKQPEYKFLVEDDVIRIYQ